MSSDVARNEEGSAGGPGGEATHPESVSVATYLWIGAILAVVTGVEVAIYYAPQFAAVEVPLLVILSTAKVVLVVMYFMHLKMDHKVFTTVFMAGLVLATFMMIALIVLYHFLPRFGP